MYAVWIFINIYVYESTDNEIEKGEARFMYKASGMDLDFVRNLTYILSST